MTEPRAADRPRSPGRPQRNSDDEVLSSALTAFAAVGYEAMSIRSLARELDLSHGALNQRFGSKDQLFAAAVDHGFGDLTRAMEHHLAELPEADGPSDALRNGLRAFLLASAERPDIVRLMNTLGITGSARLDHVFERLIEPLLEPLRQAARTSRPTAAAPISSRELFFLVAHGAVAPFTLRGLSHHFDAADGPLDVDVYAEHMAEVLLRTLGA